MVTSSVDVIPVFLLYILLCTNKTKTRLLSQRFQLKITATLNSNYMFRPYTKEHTEDKSAPFEIRDAYLHKNDVFSFIVIFNLIISNLRISTQS